MFTTRPEIIGTFGVASSTHWLASQAAMGVLERGGNAFDAAVAAGFVLQVVEPHLNGAGGEAPVLFWSERERRASVLNGQGCAPAGATPAAYRQLGLEQVPGIGLLAATVPGAVPSWLTLLREHGTWPLADVLAPAIGYANDGFPVSRKLAEAILGVRSLFVQEWTSSADAWLDGGRVPLPGTLMRMRGWASTMTRLVTEAQRNASTRTGVIDEAQTQWQQGFVAREIDRFCRLQRVRDTSGRAHGGLLRFEDMAGWRPTFEAPLRTTFGDREVCKAGFWSQGPVMLQVLAMLRHAGLASHEHDSSEYVHVVTEATKLALADRLAWYGASPCADVLAQLALLSDSYATARWGQVSEATSAKTLHPGSPLGKQARLPDLDVSARSLGAGDIRNGIGEPTFLSLPPVQEWADRELFVGDTCHISVIDRHGNMVAATPSGGWLSSSPTIPSLGFALGTRLQMTWLDEGLPNMCSPGVAPCTTLSPTLVLRDGEPELVFGTPGGDQQDQWQTSFFLRYAVYGMDLQQAIEAPAFHVKHGPSSFWPRQTNLDRLHVESRFSSDVIDSLRARGHEVHVGDAWSEGRLSACRRSRDSHGRLVLRAAANPRGSQGYAVGR